MPPRSSQPGLIAAAVASSGSPMPANSDGSQPAPTQRYRKRKNHRAGKKKRRKSFAVGNGDEDGSGSRGDDGGDEGNVEDDPLKEAAAQAKSRSDFYNMSERHRSSTSVESTDLLDHREQTPFLRARRPSLATTVHQSGRLSFAQQSPTSRMRPVLSVGGDDDDDRIGAISDESAPLLAQSLRRSDPLLGPPMAGPPRSYGSMGTDGRENASRHSRGSRPQSRRGASPAGSGRKNTFLSPNFGTGASSYNINYPPSVPGSPHLRPSDRPGNHNSLSFGDEMLREELSSGGQQKKQDDEEEQVRIGTAGSQPQSPSKGRRANTMPGSLHSANILDRVGTSDAGHGSVDAGNTAAAEADVCFPQGGLSEDEEHNDSRDWSPHRVRVNRRRRGKWPDLSILEDWSRFEVGHNQARRAKTIKEPQLVNGRLRPIHKGWHRAEEDAPYRFTYFNEEFQSTIHSQTISELVQPGGSFRELFLPDPPLLSDSEGEDGDEEDAETEHDLELDLDLDRESSVGLHHDSFNMSRGLQQVLSSATGSRGTPSPEKDTERVKRDTSTGLRTGSTTPVPGQSQSQSHEQGTSAPAPGPGNREPRYGERPVWWLDVLSPTEAEMRVLSKTFAIHPLTAEDIVMQEAREKVELFQHYYFVSYRSFDQDPNSETFLEPVNMYVVVFREGVLSFHFSMTPHPANVRRRIRQLRDYMMLSSDWVSYAIIDDITDVFVPLIQNIEDEVDDIDDAILQMHSGVAAARAEAASLLSTSEKDKDKDDTPAQRAEADSDMLRRVGACRKRVMGLYRLLGNKADVIRGFAKRCNEHWEVAPRSEIGLYLGDIQDHIVTMTSNLSHYEKILSRSHGNYLAQINIRMNERQEQTADVLGRLTVLGTIVMPMNIITGLWGMNVWVPGQDYEGDLRWFAAITAGLLFFGLACYWIAKRVYKIV